MPQADCRGNKTLETKYRFSVLPMFIIYFGGRLVYIGNRFKGGVARSIEVWRMTFMSRPRLSLPAVACTLPVSRPSMLRWSVAMRMLGVESCSRMTTSSQVLKRPRSKRYKISRPPDDTQKVYDVDKIQF